MSAPIAAARLCRVGRNLLKKGKPRKYPESKINSGKQIVKVFETNEKIFIFQYNSLSALEWNDFRYDMGKEHISVKVFPNEISRVYLKDSPYKNIAPLFYTQTAVAFGNQVNMKSVLKLFNRNPRIHLLGAVIENTIMNKDNIASYANLPSLKDMHSELLSMLSQPSQELCRLLATNSSNLSISLEQLSKQNT
ncbi:large ribosomal subunit protein uL10m [Hydra vulgaris]|uniref:Large ribosomal subunit protein uL10m n=1 Tax=Hydra vulgaris TaxID=6087 RepID=A0ABM4C442_HYDVU